MAGHRLSQMWKGTHVCVHTSLYAHIPTWTSIETYSWICIFSLTQTRSYWGVLNKGKSWYDILQQSPCEEGKNNRLPEWEGASKGMS